MSSALVDILLQPGAQSHLAPTKIGDTKHTTSFASSVSQAYNTTEPQEQRVDQGVMEPSLMIPSLYAVPVQPATDDMDPVGIRMRDRLLGEGDTDLLSDEALAGDEALLQAMIAEDESAINADDTLPLPQAGDALEEVVAPVYSATTNAEIKLAALSDDVLTAAEEKTEQTDWINVADMLVEESAVPMQPIQQMVDETLIVPTVSEQVQQTNEVPPQLNDKVTQSPMISQPYIAPQDTAILSGQQAPILSNTPTQRDARMANAAQERLRDMTEALQSRTVETVDGKMQPQYSADIAQRLAATPNPQQQNALLSDASEVRAELQWQTAANNATKTVTASQAPGAETLTVFDSSHQRQLEITQPHQRPQVMQFQHSTMAHTDPGEQVAIKIQQAALAGQDRITMQLEPADLGRVDIRMDIGQDGRTQMMVTAENRETLNLLQRDARALEQALQQAGLDLDSGSMEFNLSQQHQDGDELAQNSHSGHNGSSKGYEAQTIEEQEAHYIDPFTGRYTITVNDGLDIKV